MKFLMIFAFVFLGVVAGSVGAQAACSKEDAEKVESSVAELKSWNELYDSFKKYNQCDDGAIAEGYSDIVSQLLANQWDQLGTFEGLAKKDKKFEAFVFGHIDETMAEDSAKKITANVKSLCPKESASTCKKIAAAMK